MEHMRLHHVGIVMNDMDRAKRFMEKFGLEEDCSEYVDAYNAMCIFTKYGENSMIESPVELVIPDKGVLMEYNNGKGGIHHIAFEVEDVEKTRQAYESKGLSMLEEAAVPGACGIIVNFLRPRFGEGILVEFVQNTKKA